ncbi:MAG: hypothetical protein JWR84_2828 [Caulobacter sp.]|nr:hypothetical protein [Caulobacter sp.]
MSRLGLARLQRSPKPRRPKGGERSFRIAAFFWGVAEASLFFVVPDLLISWVAMNRGFRAGAWTSLWAALGAAIGGAVIFLWSANDPTGAHRAVAAVPAISETMIAQAQADIDRNGWFVASMKGPLTSTPYKVYALLAPRSGAPLAAFAPAALPVRLPRFLLVAGAFALIGRLLRDRVDRRILLAAFTSGWLLFYLWFWLAHPG